MAADVEEIEDVADALNTDPEHVERALDSVERTLRQLADVDIDVDGPGDLDVARQALPTEPIEAELTSAALRGTPLGRVLSTSTRASVRTATGGAHGSALIWTRYLTPRFGNGMHSCRPRWMRGASKRQSRLMTDERSPGVPSSVQQSSLESPLPLLMTMMRTVEEEFFNDYSVGEGGSDASESIKQGTKWLWSLLRYTKT